MKIIKIEVDWNEAYGNSPEFLVCVDELPDRKLFRYEQKETLFFAEYEGLVDFYSWNGTPSDGFGGRTFEITMKNGTKKKLIGPWSSRAGVMNHAGFTKCIDCTIYTNPDNIRKFGGLRGAITLELIMNWMKENECNFALSCEKFGIDEVYHPITLEGYKKPNSMEKVEVFYRRDD